MTNLPKSLDELNFKSIKIHRKEVKEIQLRRGTDDCLFVLLHGWTHKAERLSSLAQTILELEQERFRQSTILIPELSIGLFSTSKPEIIASDIILEIDDLINEYSLKECSFNDIYLIGYSAGALITRKIYLYASGVMVNNEQKKMVHKN